MKNPKIGDRVKLEWVNDFGTVFTRKGYVTSIYPNKILRILLDVSDSEVEIFRYATARQCRRLVKTTKAAIKRGLKDAKAGKLVSRGSFKKYIP